MPNAITSAIPIDCDTGHAAYRRARLARDPRFDGLFFIAVRSTGIYCRPICPAPSAKESNIEYYPHAAAAAARGYRPCLRCRPELAPGLAPCDASERGFALAWQRVRDGALAEQSLAGLATEMGISERQLRRQFVQHLGVPPLAVHATQRLLLAKQLLTETRLPVTEIAYASGYRSLRRFNQAFLDGCGMPPSRLRRESDAPASEHIALRLGYRPPYDLDAVLAFLAVRAVPGIEQVDAGEYRRIIGPVSTPGAFSVCRATQPNTLLLRIESRSLGQLPDLIRRVRRLFDLDAQPDAINETLGADPQLSAAIAAAPGLRVPGAFAGFETAVRAVLGQQVSVAAARTLCIRLVERCGSHVELAQHPDARLFPTPEQLAEADLQAIGIPGTRAATLRSLARSVALGDVDLERMQPLGDFVERLCRLPGIGPWTAQYIAMRCLHHPDAFPAGDLIVRQQLGAGSTISAAQADKQSQRWRPWRAYAVLHLWRRASAGRAAAIASPSRPSNRNSR